MATVHRIAEPENASETKAIKVLASLLPDSYLIFHNFELTTGRGMPYEYDMCVVGEFAVWHVEVKGYRGTIKGDQNQWVFESGYVQPSPIPLANKKSKILKSKLAARGGALREIFVETCVLLTDDKARVRIRDDQRGKVIQLKDALDHFTEPSKLPVRVGNIERHHDSICETLFGSAKPSKKIKQIGLYDVIDRINQTETRTVFLAKHKYISTRPQTILKVFHFDVYTSNAEKERQIQAIFHDQDAMRLVGVHPNIIDTSDMFAWGDNKFVLPTEYVEHGRPLSVLLEKAEDREITWKEKADLVAKIARALRHAHANGVVHRDIRPLNVVVAPNGVVKLVNFDLALLTSNPGLSTPKGLEKRLDRAYVAPEVFKDPAQANPVSDIYSLGILFYQLITSEVPYQDIEAVMSSGAATPLDMALLLSELGTPGSEDFMESPEDAAGVIGRMTQQDPKARYQSVGEILEDLAILSDE